MDGNDGSCEDDLDGNQEGEFKFVPPVQPDLSLAKNLIPPGGGTVRGTRL